MLIVYYKDATGKIIRHQKLYGEWSKERLMDEVAHYNILKDNGQTAYIAEVKEGALGEYLCEMAEKKRLMAQDTIREALDALDTVKNCLMEFEI